MVEPTTPVPVLVSEYSHFIIIGCSVLGLVWGGINAMFVSTSPRVLALPPGFASGASLWPPLAAFLTLIDLCAGEQSRTRR